MNTNPPFTYRSTVLASDAQSVKYLVAQTDFFRPDEIEVAEELVLEHCRIGEKSGYLFCFAHDDSGLAGYVCFGPIPCTVSSYDLYWIAVRPNVQRQHLGRLLMIKAEEETVRRGGMRMYVDTSSNTKYLSTRKFYESCGYQHAATLDDFYEPGDGKVIYSKKIP